MMSKSRGAALSGRSRLSFGFGAAAGNWTAGSERSGRKNGGCGPKGPPHLASIVVLVAALCSSALSADRKSWNKIRYLGGTFPVKSKPYDWNTTLTVTSQPPSITVAIAPASVFAGGHTVHIAASQVMSLTAGRAAWRRVAEVDGVELPKAPAKPRALFGLLQDNGALGIVYQTDDGKRAAMLLETNLAWQILPVLKALTGKTIEDAP
jgi:hypothetical protein